MSIDHDALPFPLNLASDPRICQLCTQSLIHNLANLGIRLRMLRQHGVEPPISLREIGEDSATFFRVQVHVDPAEPAVKPTVCLEMSKAYFARLAALEALEDEYEGRARG